MFQILIQVRSIKLLQAVSLVSCIIFTQAIHFRHHHVSPTISLESIAAIGRGGGRTQIHEVVNNNILSHSIGTRRRCTNSEGGRENKQLKREDSIIQTLRGGASEVVDDNDRVLVFDSEEGNSNVIVEEDGGGNYTSTGTEEDPSPSLDARDKIGDLDDDGGGSGGGEDSVNDNEIVSELVAEGNDESDGEHLNHQDETDENEEDENEAIQHSAAETTSEETELIETVNEDDDDGNFHEENKSFQETIDSKQNEASNLRIQGKQLHDDGDFQSAAQTFQKAASELDFVISIYQENLHDWDNRDKNIHSSDYENDEFSNNNNNNDHEQHLSHSDLLKLSEERATCRLHEALCHLKNKNYADSIISCTDVLMDGVQIVPFTEEYDDNNGEDAKEHQAVVVRISPNGGGGGKTATSASTVELSPAVRARAYHRRAKARLALGDTTGALDDARSAAFLGDRNAVALYGKLMRESGSSSSLFGGSGAYDASDGGGNLFSQTSPLQSLFSGDDNASSSTNSPSSFDMLGSILGGPGHGSNSASPFGAMGSLGSMLGGMNGIGGNTNMGGLGGMDGLAKSVLTSVTKRIDDRSTQEMICKFLNDMNASQISSLSSMAGVPLSTNTVDRIVAFGNGVTPKGMRRTVKLAKRIIFVGNVLVKTFKVIGKYKHLLVVMLLIAWMKSAILRPVVISKKAAKKTVETISKAAFLI